MLSLVRSGFAMLAAAVLVAACAPMPSQTETGGRPLQSGLLLNKHLAQPYVEPTTHTLPAMLEANWQQTFSFGEQGAGDVTQRVASCSDYGRALNAGLRPALDSDYMLLTELAVMCRAARALADAQPAQVSHIGALPFDGKLPSLLPADFALRSSTGDHARFANAAPEARWAEVADLTSVEIHGPEHAVYKQPGGAQVVRLIGRGDVDGDGTEDLLITSRDVGVDGALLGYRLFIVTRFMPEAPIIVLSEFTPR